MRKHELALIRVMKHRVYFCSMKRKKVFREQGGLQVYIPVPHMGKLFRRTVQEHKQYLVTLIFSHETGKL